MKNMPRKETSIEKAIAQELIERGIEYRQNIPISVAHTIPDFVLTNKVVIYCDGEYWHSKPGCKNKDCRQDFLLGMNGYKVFRFTGSEIKKSAKECVSRISL